MVAGTEDDGNGDHRATADTNGDRADGIDHGEEGKRDGDVRQLTGSPRAVTASPEEVGGDGNRR